MQYFDGSVIFSSSSLLFSADLKQHVNGPTHLLGHTLDLLITREMVTLISHTGILPDPLSDHQVVVCFIHLPRPPATRITVTRRNNRDIDLDAFQKDIWFVSSKILVDDLDGVINVFDDTLCLLLNKYAPEQTRNITLRPHAPWFSDELRELKRVKRRCERKFQSTKLTIDKRIYYQACRNYNRLLEVSKSKYLKDKFNTSDMKQVFKFVDGMFSVKSAPILPTHDSLDHLLESFSDFFESKIINIRCSLSQQPFSCPKCRTTASCSTSFSQFDCVSTNGLKTIIQS